jgi:hypothetical protein
MVEVTDESASSHSDRKNGVKTRRVIGNIGGQRRRREEEGRFHQESETNNNQTLAFGIIGQRQQMSEGFSSCEESCTTTGSDQHHYSQSLALRSSGRNAKCFA